MKTLSILLAIGLFTSCTSPIKTTSNHVTTTYKFKKKGIEYQITRTYIYKIDTLKK